MSRPKFDHATVFPIFALTFVDILGLTLILPLLHLYAIKFGAGPLEIGIVAAAFPLAQVLGVPVMGALSDRYGRKPLLLVSQITTCIGFILLALSNSLWMVILSRLIDGLFGANIATAQAAISDITTDENRAQGLGLTGAAFGLGFLFGPAISLIALEFSDNLALPAWIAAVYSLISIMITLFMFRETLPASQRRAAAASTSVLAWRTWLPDFGLLKRPQMGLLMLLMFAQQVVFYGFESLLGLFTLNRLGLLGQGNSLIFIFVGIVLVYGQTRLIAKWKQKYGETRLAQIALATLAIGLLLFALTPAQPHPLYVKAIAARDVQDLTPSATEAMIGQFAVQLPDDADRGVGGILWLLVALVPLSVGAGLIRPSLNALITHRATRTEYGAALGLSAALVTLANAIAPLLGGLIYQQYGMTAPFLLGALVLFALLMLTFSVFRRIVVAQA